MADELKLTRPWLIAVWPGMGNVAISAGYYLMAKLDMHLFAELTANELFDVEHVEVKNGLIRAGRLPRNRFFVWIDPEGQRDLVVFIGEAQPPMGRYAFCRRLMDYAEELGVERVFTFAAMATRMHPQHDSRVYGAATDELSLSELKRHELTVLEEGHISGLNGVLLGAAAERGLRGACLLGEMPHVLAQLPFPKASLAVLNVFSKMADVRIDLDELAEQVETMEQQLSELLERVQFAMEEEGPEEEEFLAGEPPEEERLSPEENRRIESLFSQARQNRSKAYELKQYLDQLGIFKDYEDRFLDLFKKS